MSKKISIYKSFNEFVEYKDYKLDDFSGVADNTILSVKKLFESFELILYFNQYKEFLIKGNLENKGLKIFNEKLKFADFLFPALDEFLESEFYKNGNFNEEQTNNFLYKTVFPFGKENSIKPGTFTLFGEGLSYLYNSEYLNKGNEAFSEDALTNRVISFINKNKSSIDCRDLFRIFERMEKPIAVTVKNNLYKLESVLKQESSENPVTNFTLLLNKCLRNDYENKRLNEECSEWFKQYHLQIDKNHNFVKLIDTSEINDEFDRFVLRNNDLKVYQVETATSVNYLDLGVITGLCDYYNSQNTNNARMYQATEMECKRWKIPSDSFYTILRLKKGLIDSPIDYLDKAIRFSLDNQIFNEKSKGQEDLNDFKDIVKPHMEKLKAEALGNIITKAMDYGDVSAKPETEFRSFKI